MDFFNELMNNRILWVAVLAWFAAQLIKVLIELIRTKKINLSLFTGSGGMPSSHTSFVIAMTMGVGIQRGFDSALFAIAAVISMIVMYDAAGVRRAAGKQAEVINMLTESLENSGIHIDKKLKELLGHSPIEVFVGGILGIIVAYLFYSSIAIIN